MAETMRRESGFTYLTVLFAVAIMGAGLALTGEVWHTAALREKEAELLFVGHQYRKAIERYYLAGQRQYPRTLEDLVRDPRQPGTVRHLRQLFPDPITGRTDWGIVKAPDGGFMGLHSLSEARPLKSAGFRLRDKGFEDAAKYSDWIFAFIPAAAPGAASPKPAVPGAR